MVNGNLHKNGHISQAKQGILDHIFEGAPEEKLNSICANVHIITSKNREFTSKTRSGKKCDVDKMYIMEFKGVKYVLECPSEENMHCTDPSNLDCDTYKKSLDSGVFEGDKNKLYERTGSPTGLKI